MAYQPIALQDKNIMDNYRELLNIIKDTKEDANYNNKNRKNNFNLDNFDNEGNIKKRESN